MMKAPRRGWAALGAGTGGKVVVAHGAQGAQAATMLDGIRSLATVGASEPLDRFRRGPVTAWTSPSVGAARSAQAGAKKRASCHEYEWY